MSTSPTRLPAALLGSLVTALALSPMGLGCAAPVAERLDLGADENWGIGDKADGGGCDRSADLCWGSADSDVVRLINRVENDVLLGEGHAPTALATLVDLAGQLEHKMTAAERTELSLLQGEVATLPAEMDPTSAVAVLARINGALLRRIRATHYVAHMVPIGLAADAELNGNSFDSGAATTPAAASETANPFFTPGMQESMQLLRDNGALGKVYAWMLESTGVLERDYAVMNASNFGTYDEVHGRIMPLGISRGEQVNRIVRHYQWAAGQVGIVAGAEGLIPIAGVPISVAHETYKLFELHSQMGFEIAAVYGWDLREGRNLFTISMMVMSYGMGAEVIDIFASNAVLPLIARTVARRYAFTLPLEQLSKQLSQRSVALLMRIFRREAQEKLARVALTEGARGVGRQVFGYATLGLAVFASGAIDFLITGMVGLHVETLARRWVVDLMMDGTSYVSEPRARDCMFEGLGAMAWADGVMTDREKNLFMAFLAKPYRIDERTWLHLATAERTRHARNLAAAQGRADIQGATRACLVREFQASMPKHRMALLAHLYAMANVDTQEAPAESALYANVRADLDGAGWFDGSAIDADQMDYVQRSIYMLVYPGTVEVAAEHREAVNAILPEDVLPYLATPNAEVARDFQCGFAGACS